MRSIRLVALPLVCCCTGFILSHCGGPEDNQLVAAEKIHEYEGDGGADKPWPSALSGPAGQGVSAAAVDSLLTDNAAALSQTVNAQLINWFRLPSLTAPGTWVVTLQPLYIAEDTDLYVLQGKASDYSAGAGCLGASRRLPNGQPDATRGGLGAPDWVACDLPASQGWPGAEVAVVGVPGAPTTKRFQVEADVARQVVVGGAAVTGTLAQRQSHWYLLNATAGTKYAVGLKATSGDPDVYVYQDTSSRFVGESIVPGGAMVTFTASQSGRHFLRVYGYAAANSYSLSCSSTGGTDPFAGSPTIAGVPIFPKDNPWNTDISGSPVHPKSAAYINSIGLGGHLHPDFGTFWDGGPIGIPYCVVPGTQPKVPVSFDYDDESDPGPYPIPPNAPIEGGPDSDGDRHILVLDRDHKLLYEVYDAHPDGAGWACGSGAIFDLTKNTLRPEGWTSADAAGLPILPGLVRYEEVAAGEIRHALRFTCQRTQRAYIHPATHWASSSTDPNLPPMGLRVRLKASYDVSSFPASVRVILTALKRYGMIVADNGSNWFITGTHDTRWNDDELGAIKTVPGSAFEAVNTGPLVTP
jgi:hypothetical protein